MRTGPGGRPCRVASDAPLARRYDPKGEHLGTVDAPDEKNAIAKAAEQFNIPPALRTKIVVQKISEK